MAIRCELNTDRDRGPGHGVLRVTGLPRQGGPVDFSLMRNQGNQPWLGSGRVWQSTETWLSAKQVETDGEAMLILVGADVIDPIVSQPTTVAYRLSVTVGADKRAGVLKVNRPLLGSHASAPDTRADDVEREQREEAERRAREEEEPRREQQEEERRRLLQEEETRRLREEEATRVVPPEPPEPEPEEKESETPRPSRLPLVLALLGLLLVAGGGVGAWYGCLVPGSKASRCAGLEAPPPPPPIAGATATCTGLSGNECYNLAQTTLAEKRFDPGRQLLQQAAGLGSIEANTALGRLYDPQTWSAETSPSPSPNWETAVYWYEKAAHQGNGEALSSAGRLLCTFSQTEFERKQGRTYLEKAVAQGSGSDEVRKLLEQCKPS